MKFARLQKRLLFVLCLLLWIIGLGWGYQTLFAYETTPGVTGGVKSNWPAGTALKPVSGKATLIMFAHPYCPCTRASMQELSKLVMRLRKPVKLYVVFFKGTSFKEQGDLIKSAASIPGAQVVIDKDGLESKRFNATVSGQTLVYDPQGQILYNGGITVSRGSVGENAGSDKVVAVVNGKDDKFAKGLAYGCSLLNPVLKTN